MLKIYGNVQAFLEEEQQCDVCNESNAEFLIFCTYVHGPHTTPLCKRCFLKQDTICECGSGAIASGSVFSVLDREGKEHDFKDAQKTLVAKRSSKRKVEHE